MSKIKDITGQQFGYWTVLGLDTKDTSRYAYWICQCKCGTIKSVMGRNLRNGQSKSCGCYHKEISSKQISDWNKKGALDLRGQKYGMLTPIEPTEKRLCGSVIWKCQCDCGNISYVSVDNLRGNHPVRSCGCIGKSIGEKNIEKILTDNNIDFIKEYKVEELKKKRYDFYLPNYNRLIEFDGRQHYMDVSNWDPFLIQQKRDKEKNEYALSHNIPLVRIPYWERDNITLEMIMGDQYLVK